MRPANVRPSRVPDHFRWKRIKLEPGKDIKGWLAGPVYGCEGHKTPVFKPCHSELTNKAKVCPWCSVPQFAELRYQGYLPFYSDRLERLVICVNLDVSVVCDGLKLHHPITLKKGRGPTSPITIATTPWTELKPTGRGVYQQPQDILPWLVAVLWKSEALGSIIECQPVVTQGAELAEGFSGVTTAADLKAAKMVAEEPTDAPEKLRQLLRSRNGLLHKDEPPPKNGKHKRAEK